MALSGNETTALQATATPGRRRSFTEKLASAGMWVAGEVYHPGFRAGEVHHPGFREGEVYHPGFQKGQKVDA